MLSPLPRKALGLAQSVPSTPSTACTPSKAQLDELHTPRPQWYGAQILNSPTPSTPTPDMDDEATQDLRAVLGGDSPAKMMYPAWVPAFDARCSSEASTTSPPPPSSLSPDFDLEGIETPEHDKQPLCPPGALDKSSWLQARKVFVGGIPQTIDQNGLYHMFSKIGKVKKAWLQLFHTERGQAPTAKKHRGFGFVIFYEKHSIDQVLGDEASRFVCFGADLKLEVKRAVGKTGGADEQPAQKSTKKKPASCASPAPWASTSPAPSQAFHSASPAPPASSQRLSPVPTWQCASPPMPPTWRGASPALQQWQAASPEVPQSWQNASPAPQPAAAMQAWSPVAPQSWQGTPCQMVVVCPAFPCVPPFPFVEPAAVQVAQPVSMPLPQPVAAQPTPAAQSRCQLLPNVLLDGFVGQKPVNSQELTEALLQALPEYYDD